MRHYPGGDDDPEAPRTRGGWPERLGDVLPGALRRLGPKGLLVDARIRKVWAEVVGDKLAEHVSVGRLKGETLIVYADSDAWAGEFRYMTDTVRERLNRLLEGSPVGEVVVYRSRRQRAD